MVTNVEKVIREYLPNIIHMSLGTTVNGKPWLCEVHFSYDDELNIYFRSKPSRRHSIEVAQNKFVAGNIVKQHEIGQKPRGVYFEGECEILTNVDENSVAYKTYCNRFNTNNAIIEEAKQPDGHQFYKIKVNKFYLFDAVESSPSQKYELNWKNS